MPDRIYSRLDRIQLLGWLVTIKFEDVGQRLAGAWTLDCSIHSL